MNGPAKTVRLVLMGLLIITGSARAATTYWLDENLDAVARNHARYRAEVGETREQSGWPVLIRRADDGGRYLESYVDDPELTGDYKIVGPYKQYGDGDDHPLIEKGQRSAVGETTGTITVYDRQGRIGRTVEYAHSKRNGKMRRYSQDGTLYRETDYVDGKIDGKRLSFHHGAVAAVEPYRDGRMDGAAEYYYFVDPDAPDPDKPPLRLRIHYRNGHKHGWARDWSRQGQLKHETHYVDGRKDGVERIFNNEHGHHGLAGIAHYRAGKRVGVTENFYQHERTIYADDGSERVIEEARINPATGRTVSRTRKRGTGNNARTVEESFDRHGYLAQRLIRYHDDGRTLRYDFAADGRLVTRSERLHGREVGRFIRDSFAGTIEQGRLDDNGHRTGEVVETRDGEIITKSHYVDDKRHGAYVRYDEQGREIERGRYEHGKRSGRWRIRGVNHYDQIWQGAYRADKRVGHWTVVDDHGRLLGAGDYDAQGREDGVWVVYDDDGRLKTCPRYDHGKRGDTPDFDAEDTPSAAAFCRDRLPDWAELQRPEA